MTTTSALDTGKRYRVLLVDDDTNVLETFHAVLADDADVVSCTSGERALRLLETDRFHVVSADYKMPRMTGVELLRRVGSLPYPVGCILVTGADEYVRAQGASPYYVLLKPVDPQRLIGLVLQLARITEMKRSVGVMAESSARAPSSPELPSEPPPSSAPESSPRSSRRSAAGSIRSAPRSSGPRR